MALPMVLVLIVIIGICVSGLYFLMQSGMRRTTKLRQATEHLYLGEAILANIVNRLKKAPWDMRYYAEGKTAPASEILNGNYRGAEYVAVVEDVTDPDTSKVVPNLCDILLRVTYKEIEKSFFTRVTVTTPTVLKPTNVNVERLKAVDGDITNTSVRAKLSNDATKEEIEKLDKEAETNVLVREAKNMAKEGDALRDVQATILASNYEGEITKEGEVLAFWGDGLECAGSPEPNKYSLAFDEFQKAYNMALTQGEIHKKFNAPKSLLLMAKARAYDYDYKSMSLADPLASPADDPMIRVVLEEGIGFLDKLITDFPDSEFVPYALLDKAKYLFKLGDSGGAKDTLEKLETDYPNVRLWGEDQTIAGTSTDDGVVAYEKTLLNEDGDFFLSKSERPDEVGQVYFMDEDGTKLRITSDPRPKDLVTVSPDGCRVSYRAKMPDDSYRVVVVDRDGNSVGDVTYTTGDWRPFWAPAMNDFEENPIYVESIPETIESTHAVNCSELPEVIGPTTTLEVMYTYADNLFNTLTAAPYNVDDKNLRSAEKALRKAREQLDKGSENHPPKKKKHHHRTGTAKLFRAVTFMEQVKAMVDAGDTRWQETMEQEDHDGDDGHGDWDDDHHHHHHH